MPRRAALGTKSLPRSFIQSTGGSGERVSFLILLGQRILTARRDYRRSRAFVSCLIDEQGDIFILTNEPQVPAGFRNIHSAARHLNGYIKCSRLSEPPDAAQIRHEWESGVANPEGNGVDIALFKGSKKRMWRPRKA